jgi:hypothetical protein
MSNPKTFETMQDAFDYCRERNQPVTVLVNGEKWKLYPSGRADRAKDQPMTNTYQPVQPSQWTRGRWQIGEHELTSGDVIEFVTNVRARRGRIEHDERGYVVIPDDGGDEASRAAVLMVNVREARYIRSGRL